MTRGQMRSLVVTSALLLALVVTGAAWGKCGKTLKGNPAVRQYVEPIQTSCGSRSATAPTGAISPEVAGKIAKGARKIEKGVPKGKSKAGHETGLFQKVASTGSGHLTLRGHIGDTSESALGAVVGGLSHSGLVALLAVMGGIAAAFVGLSIRRRRVKR
jgi:hypothetical protein